MAKEDLYLQSFEADVENAKKCGNSHIVWNHEMFPSIMEKIESEGYTISMWGKFLCMPHEYPYIIGGIV